MSKFLSKTIAKQQDNGRDKNQVEQPKGGPMANTEVPKKEDYMISIQK